MEKEHRAVYELGKGMSETASAVNTVSLDISQLRLFIALQYMNASEFILKGLRQQRENNVFHFVITLRSFIEYTRRGMWFLCWANNEKLKEARKPTFQKPGSPTLEKMDAMINEALGKGKRSHLMDVLPGISEPFLDCLHALTHGNPISVQMIPYDLNKLFNTSGMLERAEADFRIFRIMLMKRWLGEEQREIWEMLARIHNRPHELAEQERVAAAQLKESGRLDTMFTSKATQR